MQNIEAKAFFKQNFSITNRVPHQVRLIFQYL